MPRTMTQACTLCGLRYANGALLELHIREDHVQRNPRVAPAHGEGAGSRVPQAQAGPSRGSAQAPALPRSLPTVTAGTAATRHRRRLTGPAMATVRGTARTARQAVQAVRYVNRELLRASEAISLRRAAESQRPLRASRTDRTDSTDRTDKDERPAPESTEPAGRAA